MLVAGVKEYLKNRRFVQYFYNIGNPCLELNLSPFYFSHHNAENGELPIYDMLKHHIGLKMV